MSSPVRMTLMITMPPVRPEAVSTRVRQAAADVRLGSTSRSTTISMVCFLFFSSWMISSPGRRQVPSTRTRTKPDFRASSNSFGVLALAAPHHRRQHLDAGLLRQGEHLVHDLVDGLLA